MNPVKIFLVSILSLFATTLSFAATRNSTSAGGNWNSSSTWNGGTIPAAGDDVNINGPVVINANAVCKTITINSGASLSFMNGGAYKLTATYNSWGTIFTNNGTFTANDGTVELKSNGSGLTVAGTTFFNNLIIDNSQQTTLGSSTISGTLRLNNGAYITTHPTYGSSATLEINGSYSLNANFYLWPNSSGSTMPPSISFVGGTTTLEQMQCVIKKTFSVSSGATVTGTNSCFTLASTFENFSIAGTFTIGSVIVGSGATWNLNANYTINKLKIENTGVVNAGNYNLAINATTTNGCGINGMVEVITGGTFNPGTGTVTLTPTNWYNVNGNITFNNLVVNNGGSGTVVIPTANTVTVNGNVTVNTGATVNQANNINYGNGATVTNNGTTNGNNNNFPPTLPATPPSTTYISGTVSGTRTGAVAIQSPNTVTLSGNLDINAGTSKTLTIAPASELIMGNNTVTADTIYVYGKLSVSNAGGLASAFLRSSGTPVIVIGSGSTITYNGTTAQTITARTDYVHLVLNGAGAKTFAAGNYNISGDFTVAGGAIDITTNSPSFNFNGAAQSIKGLPYKNVTFSGSGNKTLTDSSNITGVITLSGSANLLSNGLITLKSTAAGTASIGPITGTATITGNVNYERYIPAGRLWRFVGWPISGNTFANSWQNSIYITGSGTGGGALGTTNSNGFDWTATNEPGLYYYNETSSASMNNKWTMVPNTSTPIESTRGYRLFVRGDRAQGTILLNGSSYTPQPVTLKGTGTPNKGDIAVPLTCSNGCGTGDGWHLIANPYPSAINWNNANWVAARTNINTTVYVYNPTQNRYGSWSPTGGSVNGGSAQIASGQSFYVKTNGSTTLTFKEEYKVNNPTAGLFGKNDVLVNNLKMQLGDNNKVFDETVVYMYPTATNGLDADLDATKPDVMNASISTYTTTENSKLIFNAIPELINGASDTILIHMPLANATYTYNLTFLGLGSFGNPSTQFTLTDAFTGSSTVLSTTSAVYSFTTTLGTAASYANNRFKLIISTTPGSLPVKLTSFTGQKVAKTSVLKWSTASEIDNERFDIQRSNDGINYTTIGSVAGSKYSVKRIDYSFVDETPATGVNYYRLKQVDRDEKVTLSTVITLNFADMPKSAITASPIPADDYITLNLNNMDAVSASVRIVDMVGKTMFTGTIMAEESNFTYPIQLDNFKSGVYFMEVSRNDGTVESIKFVKN